MKLKTFAFWMSVCFIVPLAVALLYAIPASSVHMGQRDITKRIVVESPNPGKHIWRTFDEKEWKLTPDTEPYQIAPPRTKKGGWFKGFFGSLDETETTPETEPETVPDTDTDTEPDPELGSLRSMMDSKNLPLCKDVNPSTTIKGACQYEHDRDDG